MNASQADTKEEFENVEQLRTRNLGAFWRNLMSATIIVVVALVVNQIFGLNFFVGYTLIDTTFLYLVVGLMFSTVFLAFPAYKSEPRDRVPFYDVALYLISIGFMIYFTWNSEAILIEAWEYTAPMSARIIAVAMWALVLEAARRTGGWIVFGLVLILSALPLYAGMLPHAISGVQYGFLDTATYHIFSEESILGIPMRAVTKLVFGFLLFGAALTHSGAGHFFVEMAFASLGHVRGGPAKVAIFASALFGSMSGGVISNVLTTGAVTIPAMKRTGFSKRYAAAVEVCASTGGMMMPPIMGLTAFIMAGFLGVPYVTVAIAAILPSALYFLGLFIQIDAYAAKNGLVGIPRHELRKFRDVLKEGWHYLVAFGALFWMLLVEHMEARAPLYATVILIVVTQLRASTRLGLGDFRRFITAAGLMFAELVGMLAGIGMIVGGIVITGMAGSLTTDLALLAGDSLLGLAAMAALVCFLLGFGMPATPAYIFPAILMAPALIQAGLEPIAVHLFLLYWGMLSYITPPVAIGAFAAASVAGSDPMPTAVESMRLGTILYFIPFFFLFNPALLMIGPVSEVLIVASTAVLGVLLIGSALQGYMIIVGRFPDGMQGRIARTLVFVSGLVLASPGGGAMQWGHAEIVAAAVVLSLPACVIFWVARNKRRLRGGA